MHRMCHFCPRDDTYYDIMMQHVVHGIFMYLVIYHSNHHIHDMSTCIETSAHAYMLLCRRNDAFGNISLQQLCDAEMTHFGLNPKMYWSYGGLGKGLYGKMFSSARMSLRILSI